MAKKKKQVDPDAGGKKKSGGLIGQLLSALILGVASFGAVYFLPEKKPLADQEIKDHACAGPSSHEVEVDIPSLEEIVFVQLEPLVVSLGSEARTHHLKIGMTLETLGGYEYDIEHAAPKLRDAFTVYLRAIEAGHLQDPVVLTRLKMQLLHRARIVLGEDVVSGLLITDFVLT